MKTDFEIVSPRLVLRVPRIESAREVNAAVNENWHELQKWMSWTENGADALEATEHYISTIVPEAIKTAASLHGFCRETGKYVISTGIHLDGDDFATGYMVALPFQGRGFATEACNAVIRYAFNAMNVPAIHIAYYEGNAGSERIIRKLGFAEAGVRAKAHARHLDGMLLDVHDYIMTDPSVLPPLDVIWRQRCPLNRDIRFICAHSTLTHMLFVLPVLLPYYQSIGLSFRDFLISEAVFSAVVIMAEVPSGWISDVWKRRTTLVLGGFTAICGYALFMCAQGFWTATLAQGIIGIAVALNSGTNTALLYDRLHEEGKADEYRRLDGHRHGISFYGTAFSCLIGAFLFSVHPKLPLLFDVIAIIGATIAISRVREPARFQKSVERHMFYDMKETMKYALTGHPEITGIIILSTIIMCSTKLMFWSQQAYYNEAGLPVVWFGVILTGTYIIGGAVGQLSHRAEHWGSNRDALAMIAAVIAIACTLLSAFTSIWLGMALFLTGTLAYAAGQPRINNAINSRVGPERRATILSTASLMVHFLFVPTSVIVGYISEAGDIGDALFYLAGQVLVLGCIGLWLWGRSNVRAQARS